MRMRLGPWLFLLVLLAGCFDLTLPSAPGVGPPGLVSGRLVWQRPGRLQLEPARGASVFILGTNLAAASNDDGRFLIEGLINDEGSLFIRFDGDRDGVPERQRAFRLRELGAGRGRQIALGEIALGQSAAVSGQVVRGDVDDPNGHFGTPVFVPGFPLAAVTKDDGVFLLEGLAEGAAQLAAVRGGYQAHLSGPLSLRGGEELSLAKVSLGREVEPVSGVLRGRVVDAEGSPLGGVTVSLGGGLTTLTDEGGAWRFSALTVDRYDVSFSAQGRLPAALYNVLVAGPDVAETADVVLAQGQAAGVPSLVEQVSSSRDAGTLDGGFDGGVDAGFVVGIGAPMPFNLTLPGPGVSLVANLMPAQSGATYAWGVTPGGVVFINNPSSPTALVTPLTLGGFRITLDVTVAGRTVSALFAPGNVVPLSDAGVDAGSDAGMDGGVDAGSDAGMDAGLDAGVDAGPPLLIVTDAGASALAVWVECEGPFMAPIVGSLRSGGNVVPAVISYNGVTGRLVAVFDAPLPMSNLTFSASSLQLMDGGLRQLSSVPFNTPLLEFGPALLLRDGGLRDFNAGATYTPTGVVATGRVFDATCLNGCFFVGGPQGQEALISALSPSDAGVPWRRANAAGFTVKAWYSSSEVYVRNFPVSWGPTSAPGPLFADGPELRALAPNGASLQEWTFNGSSWDPGPVVGTFTSTALRLSSAVAQQPGGGFYAQVIEDNGVVSVWTKPPAGNWQPVNPAPPTITGATSGRIASTNEGLVMFVHTDAGSPLYRFTSMGWAPLPFSGKPLDLVGRGARAYLVSAGPGDALAVDVVEPDGGFTQVGVPMSGPVRSAELAAADFGELGVAWSIADDAGTYELLISEIK